MLDGLWLISSVLLFNQHYPTLFVSSLKKKKKKQEKQKRKQIQKKLTWGMNCILPPIKREEETISQRRERRGKMLNERLKRTSWYVDI